MTGRPGEGGNCARRPIARSFFMPFLRLLPSLSSLETPWDPNFRQEDNLPGRRIHIKHGR